MVICPFCSQDYVWKVRIPQAEELAAMCFECDTVWTVQEAVSDATGTDYGTYMKNRRLVPDWKKIEKLDRLMQQ